MSEQMVTGEGNMVRVREPKFLTVVGKPANKVAFRVVRSDTEDASKGEQHMKPQVVRRQKRADVSPILRVTFPVTYTDEEVSAQLGAFGLSGYDVLRTEASILATRSDLKSISTGSTTAIRLTADGIVAEVARADVVDANPKSRISVVSLAFRADKFDAAAVQKWLADNKVEAADPSAAEGSGDFIVVRHEVAEGEETRALQLEDGVTATITRSDADDIPEGYVAVVNETAYGSWGWGQLDFAAAMADEEFTRAMDDAVYRLRDVLKNILLYSALPLAERKMLMVNALEQFKAFSVGILDSLPRTVLVAVVRSASLQPEKPEMTTKENSGATTQPAATQTGDDAPVTRGELKALIAEAVAGAVAPAKREDTIPAPANETKPTETSAPVGITRADLEAVTKEAVKSALDPVVERLAKVEGSTVVRSDTGDSKVTTAAEQVHADGKTKDVFRGSSLFTNLGIRKG